MHSALASSLSAIAEAIPDAAASPQLLIRAKCNALMQGYHARWISSQDAFEVMSVEEMISSDLWNPETGRKSRSFRVAGKIDVRARRNGREVIVDHKTCSEDIQDSNAAYWRQLVVEAQPTHYMLLEWLNGRRIDEAIWDVIRKPTISPKKLSAAEAKAAIMTGEYFRERLNADDILDVQRDGRETLDMYAARLKHDCTVERPQWYFGRRTVVRLDHEMLEYANELWSHGQDILSARNEKRHMRNSGACMNYGRPCKYLGVCSGHDSIDSANWRRREMVHAELPLLGGDGRDVLTNSRIRKYQTCKRAHYYDYELGIERAEEEDIDARYFGTVLHAGLERWWGSFINQEAVNNGDPNDASGSELEIVAS